MTIKVQYILSDYPEARVLYLGCRCPYCRTDLSDAPIYGYEHPGGIHISRLGKRMWIYALCPGCRRFVLSMKV